MPPSASTAPEDCANPLLLGWVKEWWETARERNSKGVTTYKHAYDSLKACPLAFDHPAGLQQLKGFGPKLCERLTEKLRDYCEENGLPMPVHPSKKRKANRVTLSAADAGQDESEDDADRPAKKTRKPKQYVPAYRSGAYALLLALALQEQTGRNGLIKTDLINAAEPYSNASFIAPSDPSKFYTAWNSMKTLIQKELIYKVGRPDRYALSDEGLEVANRLKELAIAKGDETKRATKAPPKASRAAPASNVIVLDSDDEDIAGPEFRDVVADGDDAENEHEIPRFTPIRLAPGDFTVELVLDVREIRAKTDRDYMREELVKKGCPPIMRALDLGDALWVARCTRPGWLARLGLEGDEIVLDWILERKRLDDLISSIRDGRFKEQKFRLRKSGLRKVIYLVEEIALDSDVRSRYDEATQSAMASIQVVNGWYLKRTQMMDETISYLADLTKALKKKYEGKPLHIIPTNVITAKNYLPMLDHLREKQPVVDHYVSYPAFASLVSKSDVLTLRDLFLKMLMCTRGITGDKAVEIQKIWKTPRLLIEAYEKCEVPDAAETRKRKINMVADGLNHLIGHKRIPKVVSQKLAEMWGDLEGASSK
ncbi:hypothetical protein QBC39DRAFT_390350 [Podospora conica]|nr:hypothetical protein QBC39DRAFT_390350 [Schizothecium conicum]